MAVVGAGKVSQNLHLPATQKSSACRLAAVCDASPQVAESVSARYSVPAMSFEDVLASDGIDAVLIAVGDPLHVDFAMMALDAGKHVLVEKPLGRSAEECSPLREKVRETGLILQVGTMKRHDPGIEYARQAVREQIGAVTSFSAWYIACGDDYVDEASVFLPVARDSSYARPSYKLDHQPYYLATHGAHIFDLIRFVVGPPVSVRAELGRRGDTYSWHGLVGLEDGAVGHFELTVYAESDWTRLVRPHLVDLLEEAGRSGVPRIVFCHAAPHLAELYAGLPGEALSLDWRSDLGEMRKRLGPAKVLQ
jgi:predicted dehydrogenase